MLSCRDYSRGQPVQVGVVQSRLNHGITQQPKKKIKMEVTRNITRGTVCPTV